MGKSLPRSIPVLPTIGFALYAAYGGEYWHPQDPPLPGIHCPKCYSVLDYSAVSDQVRVPPRYDITATRTGGRKIVSDRFRRFCVTNGCEEADFTLVDSRKSQFELWPRRIVKVDIAQSRPNLSDMCPRCGQFDCITIWGGVFFEEQKEPLPEGFYRTDLHWGCRAGKMPLILVSEITKRKLKAAGFKRMIFEPVPYLDTRAIGA